MGILTRCGQLMPGFVSKKAFLPKCIECLGIVAHLQDIFPRPFRALWMWGEDHRLQPFEAVAVIRSCTWSVMLPWHPFSVFGIPPSHLRMTMTGAVWCVDVLLCCFVVVESGCCSGIRVPKPPHVACAWQFLPVHWVSAHSISASLAKEHKKVNSFN